MIRNRARHALFAGGAAALAWAAAEELARHKTVRMTALLGLTAGLAGMATSSVKSQSTEARLNALVPKIPTPQNSPGTASNSSYNDNDSFSGRSTDDTGHTVYLPSTSADKLNNFLTAFNTLRNSHSNLVTSHNNLVSTLTNSGVLH